MVGQLHSGNFVVVAAGEALSMVAVGDAPPVVHASLLGSTWNVGILSVSLPRQSGCVYRLRYKNSLADVNWIAFPLVASSGGVRQLTDPTATGGQRSYHLRRR